MIIITICKKLNIIQITLELCFGQYKNDLDFIRNNNNTINNYVRTLKSFSNYTVKVSYFDNNNNYKCENFSNLENNNEIENYLKLCRV